ncbi:hypothetical protein [Pseudomonas graminis]|uniref:hypothetical protein n=1 Tax=Pseudomonas graminis TaxID=158627 RepID=UPI00349FA884
MQAASCKLQAASCKQRRQSRLKGGFVYWGPYIFRACSMIFSCRAQAFSMTSR